MGMRDAQPVKIIGLFSCLNSHASLLLCSVIDIHPQKWTARPAEVGN